MKGKNNFQRALYDKSYNSAALTKIRKAQKLKRLKLTYYYMLKNNNSFAKNYVF
jgi:hypothetical protein